MQVLTPVFLPYLQVKQEELPRWYHRVPHNLSTICLWTAIVNGLDLPFALSVAVYGFKRVHGSMLNNRCVTLLKVNCRICIGINSMIWSDMWHKYHEWIYVISRAVRGVKFETILSPIQLVSRVTVFYKCWTTRGFNILTVYHTTKDQKDRRDWPTLCRTIDFTWGHYRWGVQMCSC